MIFERTDVVIVLNYASGFKLRFMILYGGDKELVTHSAHWHVPNMKFFVLMTFRTCLLACLWNKDRIEFSLHTNFCVVNLFSAGKREILRLIFVLEKLVQSKPLENTEPVCSVFICFAFSLNTLLLIMKDRYLFYILLLHFEDIYFSKA